MADTEVAKLAGQTAIVTAGGGGFGRAIALGLAGAGASVAVTARRKANLEETVDLIRQQGGNAIAIEGDVTVRSDVERVAREARRQLGVVDIFVHSAGVPWPFGPLSVVDPDNWWDAAAVHVKGVLHYLHELLPNMIERKRGHVILVSSIAGENVRPNLSGYSIPKRMQISLAEHLAVEGKPDGVVAFSIHPGDVLTELSDLAMADKNAQTYNVGFIDRLNKRKEGLEDPTPGLQACASLCVALCSGEYDSLSGRYLKPTDDLLALLKQ